MTSLEALNQLKVSCLYPREEQFKVIEHDLYLLNAYLSITNNIRVELGINPTKYETCYLSEGVKKIYYKGKEYSIKDLESIKK